MDTLEDALAYEGTPANPQQTAHICAQTIANIAAYLQQAPINLLHDAMPNLA